MLERLLQREGVLRKLAEGGAACFEHVNKLRSAGRAHVGAGSKWIDVSEVGYEERAHNGDCKVETALGVVFRSQRAAGSVVDVYDADGGAVLAVDSHDRGQVDSEQGVVASLEGWRDRSDASGASPNVESQ